MKKSSQIWQEKLGLNDSEFKDLRSIKICIYSKFRMSKIYDASTRSPEIRNLLIGKSKKLVRAVSEEIKMMRLEFEGNFSI